MKSLQRANLNTDLSGLRKGLEMPVPQCINFALPVLLISVMTSLSPAVWSQEFTPSTDFKNGLIVGQAAEAKWSAGLSFELLARWDGDDERICDTESLVARLFRSADVIHRAVVLPEHALPEKMRKSLEETLGMISDQLHITTPERMDAAKWDEGRAAHIEWLQEHIKDEERRKVMVAIYDEATETVKMLVKYRTAPQDDGKTKKKLGNSLLSSSGILTA